MREGVNCMNCISLFQDSKHLCEYIHEIMDRNYAEFKQLEEDGIINLNLKEEYCKYFFKKKH